MPSKTSDNVDDTSEIPDGDSGSTRNSDSEIEESNVENDLTGLPASIIDLSRLKPDHITKKWETASANAKI